MSFNRFFNLGTISNKKERMKGRRLFFTVLILLLLSSTYIWIIFLNNNNQNVNTNHKDNMNEDYYSVFEPKSANGQKALNYSSIERNVTILRRGFDSINFTVNVSDFISLGANETWMDITFSNSSLRSYNMSREIGTFDSFTYEYAPTGTAPTGFQMVNFWIYNRTNYPPLNTGTTFTNFTIKPNAYWLPNGTTNEYSGGQFLYADLLINNSADFSWDVSVVDSTNASQQTLFGLGQNINDFIFEINSSFDKIDKLYYVKVDLNESATSKEAAEYFVFKVLKPEFLIISSSIKFNPYSVFREENCQLNVNVSALDNDLNPVYIKITLILEIPKSDNELNYDLKNSDGDEEFTISFTVSADSPAGDYRYSIIASYNSTELDEYTDLLTIKNNPPEIDSYEINDIDTDERISVLYGEDLDFNFDVFDEEGISYITVLLIDQDDEEYEISREYEDDLEITIRTEDLITGTWTVYVSVTDIDGVTTKLDSDFDTGPQEIEIVPNLLDDALPWIMFFIGLGIGIIGVIITALSKRKPKILESEILKKKQVSKKKPKKTQKPTKQKPEDTKREVPKEEEIESKEVEEQEPKTVAPKRKIKRRLK